MGRATKMSMHMRLIRPEVRRLGSVRVWDRMRDYKRARDFKRLIFASKKTYNLVRKGLELGSHTTEISDDLHEKKSSIPTKIPTLRCNYSYSGDRCKFRWAALRIRAFAWHLGGRRSHVSEKTVSTLADAFVPGRRAVKISQAEERNHTCRMALRYPTRAAFSVQGRTFRRMAPYLHGLTPRRAKRRAASGLDPEE